MMTLFDLNLAADESAAEAAYRKELAYLGGSRASHRPELG